MCPRREKRMGRALERWHDDGMTNHERALKVDLVVASPGEIKAGEAGWIIRAGFADSPFGTCLVAESPRGLCHLSFEEKGAWAALTGVWPKAEYVRVDEWAGAACHSIFSRRAEGPARSDDPRKLFVKGTEFQVKVWRALLRVPVGALLSYGRLAELVGKPKAARAVGAAVGSNPIGFLIPCHRVVRGSGAIGGYRWGVDRKRAIQAWEGSALAK